MLLGAANMAPGAVAARAEHEPWGWVPRAQTEDVESTAGRTARGWGKVMARLLMGRWVSLADLGRVVGSKRRRWGHWLVSYRPTRGR